MKRIKFLFATTLTMVVLNGFVHGQDTTLTVTSAGKVGIGTTTPTYKLEIEGGATPLRITGGGSQFQKFLFDVATGGFAIFRMYDKDVNEDFRFATNGNSWLDGGGNVGIGTTGPVAKLHLVNGSAGFTPSTASELAIESSGLTRIEVMSPANSAGQILFGSPTEADRGFITYDHANDIMLLGSGGGTKMVVDDNGNVGIGTASPGTKLEVAGQVKITGGTPGAGKVLTSDAAGLATWQTATGGGDASYGSSGASPNNAVFVSDNGNVGIGTTSPATKLDVSGAITLSPSGAVAGPSLVNSVDGVLVTGGATSGIRFNNQDNTLELMRITNAGNAGIGTTSPAAKLEVAGFPPLTNDPVAIRITNLRSSLGLFWELRAYDSGAGGPFGRFSVFGGISGGADKLVITTTGNVGIGTTDPGVFRVKVVGPGGGVSALALQNEDGSGHLTLQNNGGTTRLSMRLFSSGTVAGIFGNNSDTWISSNTNGTIPTKAFVYLANAAGNVGIGTIAPTNPLEMASGAHVSAGGVWTDASSRQYKENISNLPSEEAIAALEKLNPVKFNYKVEKDEEYVGFIAEDAPDLVATKDRQSLSPMDIVAVLTKVVQQQQKKIAELEARLNASQ